MTDLDDASDLVLSHVRRSLPEHGEQGLDLVEGVSGAGHGERELAGLDHLGAAADGRGQEGGAMVVGDAADLGRDGGGNGGGVDDDPRLRGSREEATITDRHGLEIVRRRHHDEDDVAVGQLGRGVDDLGAVGGQGLGLRPRAVVHRHVVVGVEEPSGEGEPHAASADPTDRHSLFVQIHLFISPRQDCNRLHNLTPVVSQSQNRAGDTGKMGRIGAWIRPCCPD